MNSKVIIDLENLPIEEEDRKKIGINIFFTESESDIKLGERVFIKRSEIVEIPEEERPYPGSGGLRSLVGSLVEKNIYWEDLDYSGSIIFSSKIGGKKPELFQFEAIYKLGNLQSIWRI